MSSLDADFRCIDHSMLVGLVVFAKLHSFAVALRSRGSCWLWSFCYLIKDAKTFTNFNCQRAFEPRKVRAAPRLHRSPNTRFETRKLLLMTNDTHRAGLLSSIEKLQSKEPLRSSMLLRRSPELRELLQRAAVELIGIEPTTSGLQSPRSPS
jgi:hypothetical protein